MGGKTKQSQRTKNNVRPSSSGRSAELLSNSLKLDSSYVITGSGKVLPALFPTLTATTIDQGLTPEYSVCFKKLHKKDPITKTKALQELSELVKNGNVEEVVAALPSWANVYQTLTVDVDRRVREAVQSCHGLLVSRCGRRVAPVLRRVLPAWLLAAADEHAPAQAAAQHSLQSTFPDGKLAEAILFCKTEILSLLIDNLTGNAEAMLSNKVEDASEREQQRWRVVCSSLLALQAALQRLASDHDDWLWARLDEMLQSDAFWKLAAHDAQQVRRSWYVCACSVWRRFAGRADAARGRRLVRALLARPERGAAPWPALLLLATAHQDWHEWLDKKELLVKRIIGALESGGGGEARACVEAVRGVVCSLPPDLRTKDFWNNFFDAIFTGLNNKNLLSSKSERQAWISNLAECLKYLSVQEDDYVVEVATSVHRKWLEKIIPIQDNQARSNLIRHSATQMAMLVKHWLEQSKEQNSEKYDQLIRNYWQNIGATIATQIDKLAIEQNDITQLIDAHTLMLRTIRTGYLEDTKPQRNIKFADEETESEPIRIELDVQLQERFKHNLDDIVHKTCCNYFDFAHNKQVSKAVFPSLIALLKEFECQSLFASIAGHFECENIFGLHDKVLKSWLSGDTMRCKALADIMFMMVKYLNEEELCAMYNSFQQFPPQAVEWCLSLSLSHARGGSRAGAGWLRGPVSQAAVLALSRRHDDPAARLLLLDCLGVDGDGTMLVGESTVMKVLEAVCSGLDDQSGQSGLVAELAARLAARLADAHMLDRCVPLMLKMFDLVLRDPSSASARESLVSSVSAGAPHALVSAALLRARHWLYRDLNELDMARVEHVASLCPHLLIPDESVLENSNEIAASSQILFDDNLLPQVPLEVYALRCDCIFGNINCPIEDDNEVLKTIVTTSDMDHAEMSKQDLMLFVYKSIFRTYFIHAIVTRNANIMAEVFFQEQYSLCLYEYVILKTLYDRYAFWPHYKVIYETKTRMEILVDEIFTKTPYKNKASLLIYLSEQAATKGYYWSYATRLFDDKVHAFIKIDPDDDDNCDVEKELEDFKSDMSKDVLDTMCIEKLKQIMTGNGFFHSLQAERSGSDWSRYMVMLRSVFAAHAAEPAVLRAALGAGWAARAAVVDLYYKHNHVMLYERDLTTAPWSQIVSNAAIVDYLLESVENGWKMSAAEWDFTTISLCSLVTSLRLSADCWECTKVSTLSRPVLQLVCAVHAFVSELPRRCQLEQPAQHVAALMDEWKDIFAPDLNRNLFELLVIVLKSADEHMTSSRVATISGLIKATKHMDWEHLKSKTSEIELRNIASVAIGALEKMTHHAYKYLAFFTLDLISKPMVLDDAERLAQWSAVDDDSPRPEFSLAYYHDALVHLQELVDAALAHVDGVCGARVVWESAGARVSCSLLLLAAALLRHAAAARTDLAHVYIELFRENGYAEWWMRTTLRLLPPEVAAFALEETDALPDRCHKQFEVLPDLDVYGWCDGLTVSRLSCWVLAGALGGAGAGGARGWALAAPARARALTRLVPAAVTPPLVRRHLTQLRQRAAELGGARLAVRWTRGEVRCALDLEERELELTVRFAPTHPLALPYVSTPPNSPAPDTNWIVLYLAYQNGTLLNALKMWIAAVTARVRASPQCYICYCRMHPSSGRLPTVPCHQCRNKFHSACLRKWFTTSNKSNCPLCRTKF